MSKFKPKTEPLTKEKPNIFPLALPNEQNKALDAHVERLKAKGQKISKQSLIRQMIDFCLDHIPEEAPNDL